MSCWVILFVGLTLNGVLLFESTLTISSPGFTAVDTGSSHLTF